MRVLDRCPLWLQKLFGSPRFSADRSDESPQMLPEVDAARVANEIALQLGPPPWSKEALKKAYWTNFQQAYETIKQHGGFKAYELKADLETALQIFLDHCDDLLDAINVFKVESSQGRFFLRGNALRVEQIERRVRKTLFSVISSSFALVDTGRYVTKTWHIGGYQQRVDATFANNEIHRFLQGFRNMINHKHFLSPKWKITYRPGQRIAQFLLKADALLGGYDKWERPAREFIRKNPNGIDVEETIRNYRTQVTGFHDWLKEQMLLSMGKEIEEYLSSKKTLDAETARCHWRIILTEAINRHIDPYSRLSDYLTPAELKEVERLPNGSKEQVDLMISFVDQVGACDDEIRGLVYAVFKITH